MSADVNPMSDNESAQSGWTDHRQTNSVPHTNRSNVRNHLDITPPLLEHSSTSLSQTDNPPTASFKTTALVPTQYSSSAQIQSNWTNSNLPAIVPSDSTWTQNLQDQVQRSLADQVTPIRLAGHLSVLIVAGVILLLSQIEIPNWDVTLRAFPTASQNGTNNLSSSIAMNVPRIIAGVEEGNETISSNTSLHKAAVPFTIIPEKPQEGIQSYVVQSGDTVLGIASKFGLNPETVLWSNPSLERNPDLLRIGDHLQILPVNGALHRVQPNETLSSIAAKYKIAVADIVNYDLNELADASSPLSVGKQLVIPGGIKPYVAPQVFAYEGTAPIGATKGTGVFVWPTSGSITQKFWSGHKAIDIGSWTGAPVKASDSGHVTAAQSGWNNGYGNFVIIDHGNGFVSLYAHLNSIFVRPGENIARGQQIGTVGNTGNSTGPHLHLEVRYQGVPRNPFSYLN